MPNWYFSKEDLLRTPSRLDGIDYMTEIRYRREGTRFIMNCGNRMRLYPLVFNTAFVKGFLCSPIGLVTRAYSRLQYASGNGSKFISFPVLLKETSTLKAKGCLLVGNTVLQCMSNFV